MVFWHTQCCFKDWQATSKPLPGMAEIKNIKSKTILFVEDDAVVLAAYRIRLQREGFCVQPAQDGLEAMKILHASVPDLVVLDLMLPKFNGEEVLKFIRSDLRLKMLPVIIFSTNSIIDAEQEHLLEDVSKRLIKNNCTASMLLEAVRDVLAEAPTEKAALSSDQIRGSFSTVLETAAA